MFVVGAWVGDGEGDDGAVCWVGEVYQCPRSNHFSSDTMLHLIVRNISR